MTATTKAPDHDKRLADLQAYYNRMLRPDPIVYDVNGVNAGGHWYPSVKAAAKALGVSGAVLSTMLKRGKCRGVPVHHEVRRMAQRPRWCHATVVVDRLTAQGVSQ